MNNHASTPALQGRLDRHRPDGRRDGDPAGPGRRRHDGRGTGPGPRPSPGRGRLRRSPTRSPSCAASTWSSPWSPPRPTSSRSCSVRVACWPTPQRARRRGRLLDGLDRVLRRDASGLPTSAASTSSPRRSAATARWSRAGGLSLVVSGPEETYTGRALLEHIGKAVTYVGEGDIARLVKICHNLMLGVVTQSLAEITVLAEKGGVPRAAFLEFLNNIGDGLGVHPLQVAGLRAPRLHPDVHPGPAAQGLRPRARRRPTARCAHAGRGGHRPAGAGQL